MEKKKNIMKGSLFLSVFFAGIVCTLVFFASVQEPVIEQIKEKTRDWDVLSGPTAMVGASDGESGILAIYIYPHQGTPGTAYATNLSTGAAYAYQTTNYNTSLTGNVPASTTFDIVIKARINSSDIHNGTAWMNNWGRMNLTCADLSVSALTSMVQVNISDCTGSEHAYHHYYLQDADGGAGSGFTIAKGIDVNVTEFRLEIYR